MSEPRIIYDIAKDIREDWKTINPLANEYLKGLETMVDVDEMYGMEYGDMVIAQFLDKATGWRGEKARAIKLELKAHLDGYNERVRQDSSLGDAR